MRIELWNSTVKTTKTRILLSSVYFFGSNPIFSLFFGIKSMLMNLNFLLLPEPILPDRIEQGKAQSPIYSLTDLSPYSSSVSSQDSTPVSSLFFFHLIPLHSLNHFLHCNLGLFFLFHSCYCSFVILSLGK